MCKTNKFQDTCATFRVKFDDALLCNPTQYNRNDNVQRVLHADKSHFTGLFIYFKSFLMNIRIDELSRQELLFVIIMRNCLESSYHLSGFKTIVLTRLFNRTLNRDKNRLKGFVYKAGSCLLKLNDCLYFDDKYFK